MQNAGVIDLSGVTPNWDKALPASSRFVVLAAFTNDAVRDNETGLVWELSPKTTPQNWSLARFACAQSTVGGQRGWRLPFLPELASLLDPSVPFGALALPPGHPFTNVLPDYYWSASTVADLSSAV